MVYYGCFTSTKVQILTQKRGAPARSGHDGEEPLGILRVKDLCCGEDHALASLSDGSVYVWGRGTQVYMRPEATSE